jgi:hypothetical protein
MYRKIIIIFLVFKSFFVFSCVEKERVCTKKQGSFEVEGETVTRDCTEYSYVIDCPIKLEPPCTLLKDKPCTLIESQCGESVDRGESSFWKFYNKAYACEEEIEFYEEKWRLVMGDKAIDSGCYAEMIPDFKDALEENSEFQEAAAGLHGLKESAKDLRKEHEKEGLKDWNEGYAKDEHDALNLEKDPNFKAKKIDISKGRDYKISLFKGEVRECKKNILGTRNCCREDPNGWLEGVLMSKCKPEEEQLSKLKREKKCKPIGSYCKYKVPKTGICLDKREAYCCFDTVLAKTVNVAGKKQLNKEFGDPDKPDCSGFSASEIQKIKFKEIDFTEFFEVSVVPNLKIPSKDSMLKGVQNSFSQIMKNSGKRGTLKEEKEKAHTGKRVQPKGSNPKYQTHKEGSVSEEDGL